ncbi:MAG: beta-lactamase family protein [Deltaproteobacteria bacterium]|nr:beta-lactamase family protein [Deltaproteobacteria bacterium]
MYKDIPVRLFRAFIIFSLLFHAAPSLASDDLMDAGSAATIDVILDNAIRRGLISGGVVAVGNHEGLLYSSAIGQISPIGATVPITEQTVFDLASLTKVIATTPAIMKLLENGRITLMDPLSRWFPEFEGTGREEITILDLLTHTSGLDDATLSYVTPLKSVIQHAASQKNWKPFRSRFRYADINFILLGELIQRASGQSLDRFAQEQLFAPLGMSDTTFSPKTNIFRSIAPTLGADKLLQSGLVQDENARLLAGVAGHAGLFSTASDLSRFAVMLLEKGELNKRRLFSQRVVTQMIAPYFYSGGRVVRGLGWDIYSPFSSPRGRHFSDMSFGHTGYSGSSIWIDPERDLFVILLTIRLNYSELQHFSKLRSDISTLAASIFSHPRIADDFFNDVQLP